MVSRAAIEARVDAAVLHLRREDGDAETARNALMGAKSLAMRNGYDELADYAGSNLIEAMREAAR